MKRREVTIDNIKIKVQKSDSARYLGQKYIRGTRDGRNQEQIEGSMGGIPQVPPGTRF